MHMQFFDFFQNIAPISYDFRSMNIIADLVPVIINHTNNLLFHIAAVVDFFDDLVSCIPCSDHEYIPSVHTALREVQEETGVDQLELRDPICVTDHCYLRGGIWHLKHTWWYNMLYTDPVDLTPQREEDITKAAWVARSSLPSFLKNTYPSIVEVFREAK